MPKNRISLSLDGPVTIEADLADLDGDRAALTNITLTAPAGSMDAGAILGAVHSESATVTVPPQATDLVGFPLFIDLSQMPDAFWQQVREDGGDLRAGLPDGTALPLDIVAFDRAARRGAAFVRVDITAASGATVLLRYGAPALCAAPKDAPAGRHAVWRDYEAVVTFGESNEDRTRDRHFRVAGDPNNFSADLLHTAAEDPHQGVAWDGEHWYLFDTNAIRKFNRDFTVLVAQNLDPVGDAVAATGRANLNHCGDGTVVGDHVVLAISKFVTVGADGHLCRFSRADLSFHSAVDISATVGSCSGLCHVPEERAVYGCEWPRMKRLYRFDDADFSALPPVALTEPILKAQGIAFYKGALWVNSDEFDETYRVELDGRVQASGLFGQKVAGNYEGLCRKDGDLVVLSDPTAGPSFLTSWRPLAPDLHGGAAVHFPSDASIELTGLSGLSQFTLGCTFSQDNATQKTIVSYRDQSAGATDDRVSIAVDDGDKLAVWDNANSWLHPSPAIDPGLGVAHRVAVTYDGSERRLYVDGTQVAAQSGVTPAPGDWDMLTIGMNDGSGGSRHRGTVGLVYLRPGVLPAGWLAAEHANLSDPAAFYVVS